MVQQEQEEVKYVNEIRSEATFSDYIESEMEQLPRLVTRGPHTTTPLPFTPPSKTQIDTLSITLEEPVHIVQDLITYAVSDKVIFLPQRKAKNGYMSSYDIVLQGQTLGYIAYGSRYNEKQNERPMLHIEGKGCRYFNWQIFYHYLKLTLNPRITRVDIKVDFFYGEVSIEAIREAHNQGKFKLPRATKDPILVPYGEIQKDGTNPGRTLYIGSMSSGKFMRCYEKAYEQFKYSQLNENDNNDYMIKSFLDTNEEITFNGFNEEKPIKPRDWIRMELQLRNTNCDFSLDLITNTDLYFSGSYPYSKEVLEMTDGIRPPRLLTSPEMDLMKRVANLKPICSPTMSDLFYMGYTKEEIFDMLCDIKTPTQKLIKSGILNDLDLKKAPQDE